MFPLPIIDDTDQSFSRELWRDRVVQEIDAALNITPRDHSRWNALRDNMTFYPFVVYCVEELFEVLTKAPELDAMQVPSLWQDFLNLVPNWNIIEALLYHTIIYEKMFHDVQHLVATPAISPIILRATPSVDWSRVLALAKANDLVDLAKTISSQQHTILAASDDSLRVIIDVLQHLIDSGCAEHRLLERFIEKIVKAKGILPRYLFLSSIRLTEAQPFSGGGYADVYKGDYCERTMALKVLRFFGRSKDRDQFHKTFFQEALIWHRLRHLNVLPFLGICADIFSPRWAMVSPYMKHGNVNMFLKDYPAADRVRMITGVASGLSYLHALKPQVIHGDLRGDNILVDDDHNPRIADFGLSKVIDSQASNQMGSYSKIRGNTKWHAPELLYNHGDSEPASPTAESDTYAFACVCFEIFAGECPFGKFKDGAVVMEVVVKKRRPARPINSATGLGLDNNIWSLMEDCWKERPDDRPSMKDVLAQLTDGIPFLSDDDESVLSGTSSDGTMSDELEEGLPQMHAQYSYTSRDVGHLPLTEGMRLKVLNTENPDWWIVMDVESKRRGVVPSSYLYQRQDSFSS